MMSGEDWAKVARILLRQTYDLVEQTELDFPLTITIAELGDRGRIVMQIVWPAEERKFELGPLCPLADELTANWPLHMQIEDAAGNSVEYSLEPRKAQ
jgi:hypothetical protein